MVVVVSGSSGDIKVNKGRMLAALWLTSDKEKLDHYFNRFSNNSPLKDELKEKILNEFDEQVERKWNDQRSGSKLEPVEAVISPNKKLADGIARDNLVLAGRAGLLFLFMASGTGASKPSIGQHSLDVENARVDAEVHPQGNVLKTIGRFPTTIPTATICEFGACDEPQDPATFSWRSIIENVSQQLPHTQGVTEYTGSHSEVTYSQ